MEVTKDEAVLIDRIGRRAYRAQLTPTILLTMMDIETTHCNGCRLDLRGLLEATESDFAHDITGIFAHLERSSGRLTNCFSPRFAEGHNELQDIST